MKKLFVTSATLIALSVAAPAKAGESVTEEQKQEMIGFGAGATAGAIIAGPVGAAIGGLFGLLIADDVNDKDKLDTAKQQLDRQKSQLVALQAQYDAAVQEQQIQLVAIDQQIERVMQEVESNIQFKTASYQLEEHFKPQLDLIAKGLKANPEWVVSLSGFADSRGDSNYNQALSEQRVLSVKDYLLDQGVDESQMITRSFGEAQPVSAQANGEDYFFDRRVMMRVEKSASVMTAAN